MYNNKHDSITTYIKFKKYSSAIQNESIFKTQNFTRCFILNTITIKKIDIIYLHSKINNKFFGNR